jgi:uncharacterized membrane protein
MTRRHPAWVEQLLSAEDLEAIRAAIAVAERQTAAEIRVHVERRAVGDVLAHARAVFHALAMHRTGHRAGVLLYLAVDDRRFAIVGDQGVHARVGSRLWDSVRDRLQRELRAGRMREGMLEAIGELGRVLAEHYPRRASDPPESSDLVSSG